MQEDKKEQLRSCGLIAFHWLGERKWSWVQAEELKMPGLGGLAREGWWLVPRGGAQVYEPLKDEPALFQRFAEVEDSMEGISDFAARYGHLGVAVQIVADGLKNGEFLADWRFEIWDMRDALAVWDALKKRGEVERWIKLDSENEKAAVWRASFTRLTEDHRRVATIASEDKHPELWKYLLDEKPGAAVRLAGLFFVQGEINRKLTKNASPSLLYNPARRHVELHLTPHNLLGAMWMQFARAVEGEKDYRRCQTCREWFEVSQDGRRRQALYCSNRCRVSAHRKKKAEAVKRAAAGEKLTAIARDLDTKPKTVRGWVREAERKRTTKEVRK